MYHPTDVERIGNALYDILGVLESIDNSLKKMVEEVNPHGDRLPE